MAEGFARTYGSDVLISQSAGLAPAPMIAPLTHKVMREKNIDLAKHYPKGLDHTVIGSCDVVINISGQKLMPFGPVQVEEWMVRDPIGQGEEVFREVANEIEQRVMRLILNLRAARSAEASRI
jgi:protein-tyrosine-phosphatase